MKSWILNSLLLCGVFIVGIFMMEFGIRFLFPIYDPSGQVKFNNDDASLPVLGQPNQKLRQTKMAGDYDVAVTFNAYGLRDEHDIVKGTVDDLYVIGDSFTFGWGVEFQERYSNLLGSFIKRRAFNVATPGDFENARLLLEYAKQQGASPRDIIIGICMENDLGLYDQQAAKHLKQAPPPEGNQISLHGLKAILTSNSALYKMIASVPAIRSIASGLGLVVQVDQSVHNQIFDPNVVQQSISKLLEVSKPYNATLLIIPSRALWVGNGREDASRTHDAFIAALKRNELSFVDMRSQFEATGNPMQFHFKNDGHWTAAGHAAAAKALAAYLKDKTK
jgi:hypothetical protein